MVVKGGFNVSWIFTIVYLWTYPNPNPFPYPSSPLRLIPRDFIVF